MNWYKADLHIHSVLSPCGSLEMDPDTVMKECKNKKINLISITDHNCVKNSFLYGQAAAEFGIDYFYGIEVQTSEEIHVIVLFDSWQDADVFGSIIYDRLIPLENDPSYFGDQVILGENNEIIGFEKKALINSTDLALDELFILSSDYNGFAFPAHVDAESFSIISQLGFIPKNISSNVLGITAKCEVRKLLQKHPFLKDYRFIRNSDSHYPEQIGSGFSMLYFDKPTISELKLACNNEQGRKLKL